MCALCVRREPAIERVCVAHAARKDDVLDVSQTGTRIDRACGLRLALNELDVVDLVGHQSVDEHLVWHAAGADAPVDRTRRAQLHEYAT